ncbi:uncharacterized protein LOC105426237 isoform X2 [Pogonomyrmex barbatus]|uniref:Uncharacterized protein LOC105426237 isoform X2 n=1 Tax=Pogonomyrmex barbatus TaxID=144034 RepID=A0A6I9W350_9HYME|nr:uncharacterized protein LOC105426237 isoform X2 [Pogonomyrmex barbatus]
MNFTEQYRQKILAFIMPPVEGPISGWKGYALRITVLAVGVGIYVLLFKRNNSSSRRWGFRGTQETQAKPNDNSSIEIINDDKFKDTYGEVCPICLGVPKIGVKASCGHLLCAECLANYCDVRIAPMPPPCPLCRAPLNSVALACDFKEKALDKFFSHN